MDFADYEKKLITKLETDLTAKVKVEGYPQDFDNYVAKNRNGAVLVVWQGGFADPSEPNNEKTLVQNVTYTWQFTIIQKSLKLTEKHHGVYGIMEDIRTILSGFTPAGFDDSTVLEPVEFGFLEQRHGLFIYQITFMHTIPESES